MIYWTLFWEFLKIGMVAIGGGLATLPFLYDLTVKTNWFTAAMLVDMIAISESTPGPIGINMATYAGFTAGSFAGGLIASLALILPGVILMMFIGNAMQKFKNSPLLLKVFYGIRPAVAALIAYAAWEIIKVTMLSPAEQIWQAQLKYPAIGFFLFLLFILRRFKIHPIAIIAMAAIAGTIIQF
ncbi:MAG: chromate transporter [Firmicutes bacterium HGW-Firmicutes-10]|jgi:chromate transporter|nr:MAG: chromate transporter [Firmicutes bacterium HGW-Firmicutes-10]